MSSNSVTLNDLNAERLKKIWKVFDKLFGFGDPMPVTKAQIVKMLRGDRDVLFSRHSGLRKNSLMTWGSLSVAKKKDVDALLKIVHESKWD